MTYNDIILPLNPPKPALAGASQGTVPRTSHHTLMYVIYVKTKPARTCWGRVMHICISKLLIIGSDNGLSPDRHQAIIWPNAGILLIWTLEINFSEISSKIQSIFILENAFKNCPWHYPRLIVWPSQYKRNALRNNVGPHCTIPEKFPSG